MKTLAISILIFLTLGADAHMVQRSPTPQFQFSIDDNQSGIKETDVWIVLALLNQEFGSALGGNGDWMLGFKWETPYIGAGSNKVDDRFSIMLYGGLVRARYSTLGSLAAILCHEIGHALGGPPFQVFPGETPHWSSAEGQSDTFAAATCLPRLYDQLQKQAPHLLRPTEEPTVHKLCSRSTDPHKCEWVATSGIDFIQMSQVYFELDKPQASPDGWDASHVSETLHTQYPSYQCRMDIYKSKAADPAAQRRPCWFAGDE